MIAFLQANSLYSIKESIEKCTAKVKVFVGERENAAMKKSAQIINENLKSSSLRVMRKKYHGEFSINHANDYVEEILAMVKAWKFQSCGEIESTQEFEFGGEF